MVTKERQNERGNGQAKAYGFDQGATRDVGDLFIPEVSKTIANGTCLGHHNGVVIKKENYTPISFDRATYNQGTNAQYTTMILEDDTQPTLTARRPGGVCDMERRVRRLTPTECGRLQGFPDGWCDIGDWVDSKGKKRDGNADAPKYKALGNSIALPYWKWLCKRISAQYERDATLGSLFDGIGGFDICWAMTNGVENCRWSSEIEEFPIAVLKKHFGDEDAGIEGDFDEIMRGTRYKKTKANATPQPIIFEPGVTSRDSKHIWEDGTAPTIRSNPGDNMPSIVQPDTHSCQTEKSRENTASENT